MSERPKPPTEDDLPDELSIVDVPAGPAAASKNSSRGMLGVMMAAVLGSITAVGLFLVAKPYLIGTDASVSDQPNSVSENANPRTPVVDDATPGHSGARTQPAPTPAETSSPSTANGISQTNPPGANTPDVPTDESVPGDEPFPGLNAKLNNVIPLETENPTQFAPENAPQTEPEPLIRHPKPAEGDIAQANRDIDALFLPQIRNAKTPEEKMQLVDTLKKSAQAEPPGSATRFVLLERAKDLAVDAPDANLTNELISLITTEFDVAPYHFQLQAVDTWDRMKMPDMSPAAEQEAHRLIARKAAIVGNLAYERQDFKTAAAMYAIASQRRDRAHDKQIADLFDKKRTAARTQESRQTLTSSLLAELKATPQDSGKHLEAGIACVQTGLWEEGLNCLSQGSDESLQTFAQEQLKLRTSPLQAGDHCWDALRQLDRRHSLWLKKLAIANYESAFAELTPLQLQKVKLRVEQVGPVSCVLPVPIQHFAFEADDISTISKTLIVQNRMGHFCNGQLYGPKTLALGIRGSSVELDGRGGMVVCPQTENLIPGDSPFTVSLWINTDKSQDAVIAGRMYQSTSRVQPDFHLRLLSSGHCVATLDPQTGGGLSVQSRDPVPRGQWVHLAMTWDLESLKLYLDGRESASLGVTSPYPQRILANRAWISFGGEKPPKLASPRFDGRLDEVRVYDQALSPLQIFHVYLQDQTTED